MSDDMTLGDAVVRLTEIAAVMTGAGPGEWTRIGPEDARAIRLVLAALARATPPEAV